MISRVSSAEDGCGWTSSAPSLECVLPALPVRGPSGLRKDGRGGCNHCDNIGRFLKVLGEKIPFKGSPNVWRLLGYFENMTF